MGGTYLGQGLPGGYPPVRLDGVSPHLPRQSSTLNNCYAAGVMPLAFIQEDLFYTILFRLHRSDNHLRFDKRDTKKPLFFMLSILIFLGAGGTGNNPRNTFPHPPGPLVKSLRNRRSVTNNIAKQWFSWLRIRTMIFQLFLHIDEIIVIPLQILRNSGSTKLHVRSDGWKAR